MAIISLMAEARPFCYDRFLMARLLSRDRKNIWQFRRRARTAGKRALRGAIGHVAAWRAELGAAARIVTDGIILLRLRPRCFTASAWPAYA